MMSNRSRRRMMLGLLVLGGVLMASALPGSVVALSVPPLNTGPIGIVCTTDTDVPGLPTFNLRATSGYIYTPDGNTVFMWSYASDPGDFQLPSPVLCVNAGDTVTINLTNDLPDPPGPTGPENTSIVFPGQTGVTASLVSGTSTAGLLTLEANPGATVSYTFVASEPGTYLYESGTRPHEQIEMGLYGALLVYPSPNNQAYNDSGSAFGQEYLILLHEIDPDLHYAVEQGLPYDATTFHPDYWTVNGRSFPDTIAPNNAPRLPSQPYGALVQVTAGASQPVLIRYANAGLANHPFHPHGDHLRVIARDGRRLTDEFEDFTRTIGSGQTYDLLFDWNAVDAWIDPGGAPVPVQIPGLQNLIFKDGATFYSGDAELGNQGELPVDIVTYNECGEFYFPWHSHALFEFTNFDEGFGGLATLLRVNPPLPNSCPAP